MKFYNNATKNLKWLKSCGNIKVNNTSIDAYHLDDKHYRLEKVVESSYGADSIKFLDISIEDYDNLDRDYYNDVVLFNSANDLFKAAEDN